MSNRDPHDPNLGGGGEDQNNPPIPVANLGDFWLRGPVLGQGGTGVVFEAEYQPQGVPTGVLVALKMGNAEMLTHEANMLAAIHHPHVVRPLFRSGPAAGAEVFLALPLLRPLAQRASDLELPALQEAAEALEAVHEAGVVHGDVKPENVMQDADHRVILADFSHSVRVGEGPAGRRGTEGYIAPELSRGHIPSPASDLYSFGVMVYERLFGQRPDLQGPLPAVFQQVFTTDPVTRAHYFPSPVDFMLAVAADPDPRLHEAWVAAQTTRHLPIVKLDTDTQP